MFSLFDNNISLNKRLHADCLRIFFCNLLKVSLDSGKPKILFSASISTCAWPLSILLFKTSSNPPMTDNTMTSAATPKVTPRIEKTVINDRPLCLDRLVANWRHAAHRINAELFLLLFKLTSIENL